MLFIEAGEKRSISSERGLLKLCSMILIAIFGLKCVGLLAIINLFLHLLLIVLVWKILLTCGAVTPSSFTILLMAQLPQTCCLLLTLASPMMSLIGHPSRPK